MTEVELNGAEVPFEEKKWAVFYRNGSDEQLLKAVKNKAQAKHFVTEYITQNPDTPKDNIVPRALGKPAKIRTQETVTL